MSRITNLLGIFIVGMAILVFSYGYYITHTIPSNFPVGSNFTVNENESLRSISMRLENEHYINSALWFRVWVSSLGKDRHIQLGSYQFDTYYVLGAIVKKLVSENPDKPLIQITVPEGSPADEIAKLVNQVIPGISVDEFIKKVDSSKSNGKLFPSTYFLLPSNTSDDVIKLMTETFEKKYISAFRWTVIPEPLTSRDDVVTLASVLEGEANNEEGMKIVAGILLSRLKKKMPLQVDAAKETYATKGLPKKPINNPGLMALGAALNPTDSPYLFYITGKDGAMYYAKTFTEHKKNIAKYLK